MFSEMVRPRPLWKQLPPAAENVWGLGDAPGSVVSLASYLENLGNLFTFGPQVPMKISALKIWVMAPKNEGNVGSHGKLMVCTCLGHISYV